MIKKHLAVALVATAFLAAGPGAAATAQINVVYACDAGSTAYARYDTKPQGGVSVTFGGNTLVFDIAPSGSGARYTTVAGPHAIAPLEWWTKGRDATLSELATHGGTNRLIATCHGAK